jgi:hypothetical protein
VHYVGHYRISTLFALTINETRSLTLSVINGYNGTAAWACSSTHLNPIPELKMSGTLPLPQHSFKKQRLCTQLTLHLHWRLTTTHSRSPTSSLLKTPPYCLQEQFYVTCGVVTAVTFYVLWHCSLAGCCLVLVGNVYLRLLVGSNELRPSRDNLHVL